MNDLILYTTEDGKNRIQLRADLGTVWLTQLEMGELFDATKQNISLHLKNIIEDGELDANSVVKESLTTASDTKRYRTQLYNLDAILGGAQRVACGRRLLTQLGHALTAEFGRGFEERNLRNKRAFYVALPNWGVSGFLCVRRFE